MPKLASAKFTDFKRFHQLSIEGIPPAKLVLLLGPNGSGKSSVFDGLMVWQTEQAGYGGGWDAQYHSRSNARRAATQNIELQFHTPIGDQPDDHKKLFYFRSAYRHQADFRINNLQRVNRAIDERRFSRMIDGDESVSHNYQRLISNVLEDLFERDQSGKTVDEFKEEVIGDVREALLKLFPTLGLNSLGSPLQDGTFRFKKGATTDFPYKNLSGGEKAAFDLILDFTLKKRDYTDTVYCIDEPETHMNSRLQGDLLDVLLNTLPENCQIWIATHSIGMMRRALELYEEKPQNICFISFFDQDFDQTVKLSPVTPSRRLWEQVLDVALDDLGKLVAPNQVITCEGHPTSPTAGKNAEHDAICYNRIFEQEFPRTKFISGGNSTDVKADRLGVSALTALLSPATALCRLVDKDDHNEAEVAELKKNGITVLSRRTIESYLYDDEVLHLLCDEMGKPEKLNELVVAKQTLLSRNNSAEKPSNDMKSIAGLLYNKIKTTLDVSGLGSNHQAFERDCLANLIVPGTQVYAELKSAVFGQE